MIRRREPQECARIENDLHCRSSAAGVCAIASKGLQSSDRAPSSIYQRSTYRSGSENNPSRIKSGFCRLNLKKQEGYPYAADCDT